MDRSSDRGALRPESTLVSAGRPARSPGAGVNRAISMSATFAVGGDIDYGRSGNDTTQALESALGELEGGVATTFASGVAATAAVLDGLPAGSVVVIPTSFYNFHATILDDHQRLGRVAVRRADTSDPDQVARALDGASLLWLEVPTNPMLRVPDIDQLAAIAHDAGALSVVDATVATPLGLSALQHGADIVMHSATKSISGHSDVLLGVLIADTAERAAGFFRRRALTGALPGALDAFLALRGLRTLSVRRDRAQDNAGELARRLCGHARVRRVHYPGLAGHPDADTVAKLLKGAGSLLSFEVDGDGQDAEQVCERVGLICHATSLGGVESLMERRGRYPAELVQGTPENLIRLSVGIEHVEDLWDDLNQAIG